MPSAGGDFGSRSPGNAAIAGGETADEVAADATERARQAFDLIEKGLSGYAVKA